MNFPRDAREQGELNESLAVQQAPIKPENLALTLIIVIVITAVLATIIIAMRIYVRAWMLRKARLWGLEDTFAVLSYVCLPKPCGLLRLPSPVALPCLYLLLAMFLSSVIFAVQAAYHGLGTRDEKLNQYLMMQGAKYLLYSHITYSISIPLVKASIVFMLIRITPQKRYRYPLFGFLFVTTVMAIVGISVTLAYCKPIKAYWNPLLGKCGDPNVLKIVSYVWTASGIITDWGCAILPCFIVRKLQMSRRTKAIVMVNLGLGAVASAAVIIRTPYVRYYSVEKDRLYYNGYVSIWCQLESGIGIIAASIPSLRKLFKTYFGLSQHSSSNPSKIQSSRSGGAIRTIGGSEFNGKGVQLDTLGGNGKATRSTNVTAGKWRKIDDDCASSTRGIRSETTIDIETASLSEGELIDHRQNVR
ncbi:hypothetical protein G7046_g3002 [Stylonectria norvegica]|nr:hypothetical protein G7046_g3002 [Stylonectria norvegica]